MSLRLLLHSQAVFAGAGGSHSPWSRYRKLRLTQWKPTIVFWCPSQTIWTGANRLVSFVPPLDRRMHWDHWLFLHHLFIGLQSSSCICLWKHFWEHICQVGHSCVDLSYGNGVKDLLLRDWWGHLLVFLESIETICGGSGHELGYRPYLKGGFLQ